MTSYRQIEANRRNALKSTGPRTEAGKEVSRRNALRHGLTAETVISAMEMPKITRHWRQQLLLIMTPNRLSSGSWSSGSLVFCGACAAPRPWRPVYLRSKPGICAMFGKAGKCFPVLMR